MINFLFSLTSGFNFAPDTNTKGSVYISFLEKKKFSKTGKKTAKEKSKTF